jgi:hypothetical protein
LRGRCWRFCSTSALSISALTRWLVAPLGVWPPYTKPDPELRSIIGATSKWDIAVERLALHRVLETIDAEWRALMMLGAPVLSPSPWARMPDQVDCLHHARVGIAGPVTFQQLDLYMIERIEVGKAVLNRARQQGF